MNVWGIVIFLPIVCAIIGWTTKWAALKLIFKPERRIGIGPFAWQGIIIRRSEKFAAGIASTVTDSALDIDELFDRIDPVEVAEVLQPAINDASPQLAQAAVDAVRPGLWDEVAPEAREGIADMLSQQSRVITADVIHEIKPVVKESIDVHDLVVSLLSGENAGRLSRLVQTVGSHELRWVIWYGAVMGFVIGFAQVGFYLGFEKWWLLPIVGAFDGLVNNWLAIQMIFLPRERKKYLGVFPYQGMFPARQAEISRNYAAMMADDILTPENLAGLLARNGGGERVLEAARHAVRAQLEPQIGLLAGMGGVEPTPELVDRVLDAVTAVAADALGPARGDLEAYLDKRLELATTMEQRLAALPKDEFERILRDIFREDEATLIVLGGVLGALIGVVEAGIVVASGLAS